MDDNKCPGCGSTQIYNSGFKIECPTSGCRFFSTKQLVALTEKHIDGTIREALNKEVSFPLSYGKGYEDLPARGWCLPGGKSLKYFVSPPEHMGAFIPRVDMPIKLLDRSEDNNLYTYHVKTRESANGFSCTNEESDCPACAAGIPAKRLSFVKKHEDFTNNASPGDIVEDVFGTVWMLALTVNAWVPIRWVDRDGRRRRRGRDVDEGPKDFTHCLKSKTYLVKNTGLSELKVVLQTSCVTMSIHLDRNKTLTFTPELLSGGSGKVDLQICGTKNNEIFELQCLEPNYYKLHLALREGDTVALNFSE